MPRFRPPAKLERDALADLWKHTLSNVTTFSGRLIYLAALRDSNSGSYKHYGLIATFGRDEAVRAMRQSHTEAFHSWLQLTLAEKNDDLRQYLRSLDDPQDEVVEYWLRTGVYRTYVPASAMAMETEYYFRDLETLLTLLNNERLTRQQRSGGVPLDRGSSQPV